MTNRQSFDDVIEIWIPLLRKAYNDKGLDGDALDSSRRWGITLLANQCDLEAQRVVSSEEGLDLAEEMTLRFGSGQVHYFETSAKTGQGVEQVFYNLAATVLRPWFYVDPQKRFLMTPSIGAQQRDDPITASVMIRSDRLSSTGN